MEVMLSLQPARATSRRFRPRRQRWNEGGIKQNEHHTARAPSSLSGRRQEGMDADVVEGAARDVPCVRRGAGTDGYAGRVLEGVLA